MKDRKTQRAVKNILHNELGITKEKVESLITEYVGKKFDNRLEILMNTLYFENRITSIIQKQTQPIVRDTLKNQLAGINIDVSLVSPKTTPLPPFIYLITNETDRTVIDTFCEFLAAKKECEELKKKYPEKTFIVIESKLK